MKRPLLMACHTYKTQALHIPFKYFTVDHNSQKSGLTDSARHWLTDRENKSLLYRYSALMSYIVCMLTSQPSKVVSQTPAGFVQIARLYMD